MNICEELAAGVMTGFLISAGQESVPANLQSDGIRATSADSARRFIVLFGRIDSGVASKLGPYLKATPEAGKGSPSIDDLRVQKRALALIAKALEYVDREGASINAELEYREG